MWSQLHSSSQLKYTVPIILVPLNHQVLTPNYGFHTAVSESRCYFCGIVFFLWMGRFILATSSSFLELLPLGSSTKSMTMLVETSLLTWKAKRFTGYLSFLATLLLQLTDWNYALQYIIFHSIHPITIILNNNSRFLNIHTSCLIQYP